MKAKKHPILPILAGFALALPTLSYAGNAYLKSSDASSTTSLTGSGTNWTITGAPNSANDYYTSNFFVRTPTGSGSVTFGGNSLTLQPPSGQSSPNRSMLFKGNAGYVIIINNLTNAGGLIDSGAGAVAPPTFTGNLMTVVSNSSIVADQGSFIIGYPLAGSADLTNSSGNATTITYTNNNSQFTGRFVITNSVTVAFTNGMGPPGNPAVFTPSQIDLATNCTLLTYGNTFLTNSRGGVTLEGGTTINVTSNTLTISEPITDNGNNYSLIKRGGAILTLSGSNTIGGGVFLYGITTGSQLNINNPGAIGAGTFTINNGNNAAIDNTSGGLITLANNNAQTWQNSFAFIGSSSLDMGSGAVTITGNLTVTASNNNLTVGPVTDSGSGYSLSKQGAGTLTLNGGGSYTGATTVGGGTLAVTGSGSTLASTTVNVATNAILDMSGAGGYTMLANETLSGGTINGSLTDNTGVSIFPGGSGAAGTLTVNGNLTLNGGSTFTFDLSSANTPGGGTNDLVVVTDALDVAGATTIQIVGLPTAGAYTLFQYGSFPGNLANLSVPTGYALTNNTSAQAIQLLVTHVLGSMTWVGDGVSNEWDAGITANWLQGGTNTYFFAGDTVTFNDSGSATPAIDLVGTISPASTTVNSTENYDFTGSGIITGTLTKSGTGTLILENTNTYSGATVITGGTLQVGNPSGTTGGQAGSLGTGPVTNNATLAFDLSAAGTLPNAVHGSGTLSQIGSGSLTISGSNDYTGPTIISSGIVYLQNGAGLGATNNGTTVASGGQLYITANVNIGAEALTLNGDGDGNGALRKGAAGVTTNGGAITLGSDSYIGVDGGATLILTNLAGINGALANANLFLQGASTGTGVVSGPITLGTGGLTVSAGIWTVAPTNNYTGVTTLNGGDLRISTVQALGPIPAAFNASQVSFNGGTLEATTNLAFNEGKIGFFLNGNGTFLVDTGATLVVSNPISGAGNLTKSAPGTLILSGSNSFTGKLNVDTINNALNDGIVRVTSPWALASINATPGTATIVQGNNNSGYSILQLDGTNGSIVLPQEFALNCRNNSNPNIENLDGSNVISGNIDVFQGGSAVYFQSDSGVLVFSGDLQYQGSLANGRDLVFTGAGNFAVPGQILLSTSTTSAPTSVYMSGTGQLALMASNSYDNATIVSNGVLLLTGSINSTGGVLVVGGTLAGTGAINDNVTVQSGGTFSPGNPLGAMTIASNLVLQGTSSIAISKTANSSGRVSGLASVTYGGTLAITNLAGTLNVNDAFTLFSAASASGNFSSVTGNAGSGLAFSFNPSNGVLTVVTSIAPNPTNLLFNVSGTNLTLSWPSAWKGWYIQSNSVNVTVSSDWYDLAGSESVTSLDLSISPGQPKVFYRMRHP
jgi:autotransporter-associated beta strand protein